MLEIIIYGSGCIELLLLFDNVNDCSTFTRYKQRNIAYNLCTLHRMYHISLHSVKSYYTTINCGTLASILKLDSLLNHNIMIH